MPYPTRRTFRGRRSYGVPTRNLARKQYLWTFETTTLTLTSVSSSRYASAASTLWQANTSAGNMTRIKLIKQIALLQVSNAGAANLSAIFAVSVDDEDANSASPDATTFFDSYQPSYWGAIDFAGDGGSSNENRLYTLGSQPDYARHIRINKMLKRDQVCWWQFTAAGTNAQVTLYIRSLLQIG